LIYILKLLAFVLTVGCIGFAAFRIAFTGLLSAREYRHAWLILLATTVLAYLGKVGGVFVVGLAVVAVAGAAGLGGTVRSRLAVFLLMLVAAPPVHLALGGVGGVNYLIDLTHTRVLSLALLLGPMIGLASMPRKKDDPIRRFGWLDVAVLAFPVLKIVLIAPSISIAALARTIVETGLDIWLPYYVITRGLRAGEDLRLALGYLMVGLVAVAAVAIGETVIQHNVYSGLQAWYGINWQLTYALMRGAFLRVQSTTPQPIILAFELTFALGLWTLLRGHDWRQRSVQLVYVVLIVALVSTWSRGPWLSAGLMVLCFAAAVALPTGAFRLSFFGFLAAALLINLTGLDESLFAGLRALFEDADAKSSSIDYRRELLETALALIRQSPWIGVPNYGLHMENLRQGEGIIDVVNTYVRVALDAGLIGLGLYVLPYLLTIIALVRELGHRAQAGAPRAAGDLFAAAALATLVALLATIFTTSVWFVMPQLLLIAVAVPAAWLRMPAADRQPAIPVEAAPSRRGGLPAHARGLVTREATERLQGR